MCRIVGIADFNNSLGLELESTLLLMRDSMYYGGPDDAGIYVSNDRKVALANRRLAIIDPSPLGHQPMSNYNGTIWITYNGAIYNFEELRSDLIKLGHKFRSRSDTETIICGYQEWGIEKLLLRLRGMFAFAIYDAREQATPKLVLARDRFGIKPLYYFYKKQERFIFSSEVKSIQNSGLVKNVIEEEAIIRFLQLGSVPASLTTLKNVFSLPASHYMVVDSSGLRLKQYWNLVDCFRKFDSEPFDDALENTRSLLEESIRLRLPSDVPSGIFLSGGIDSSSLVALASSFCGEPLKTLSIIFNDKEYNEALYSREVAQMYGTNHHEILLDHSNFIKELPLIFETMDQPSIDTVNSYFVSRAAKEIGLKVALSGIGGDEVFLGYDHFKLAEPLDKAQKIFKYLPAYIRKTLIYSHLNIERFIGSTVHERLDYMINPTVKNNYLLFRGLFSLKEIQNLLGIDSKRLEEFSISPQIQNETNGYLEDLSLTKAFNFLDFNHYLQNQILKDTDSMGMKCSIEIRTPYLDHVLIEKVLGLNLQMKMPNGINKPLLVGALHNALPEHIYKRKKMGFVFPLKEWIGTSCSDLEKICLLNSELDSKVIKKTWSNFKEGKVHWSRVWALTVLGSFKSKVERGVAA